MPITRPSASPLTLPFTKMQGIGNDFIVIDDYFQRSTRGLIDAEMAKRLCDRRFGIGADQILWLKAASDSVQADLRMDILNADGSPAEMCGNGIRAVALYVHDRSPEKKAAYRVETPAGIKSVKVRGAGVTVDMGVPVLGGGFPTLGEEIEVGGVKLRFFEVGMGNPHAVFFVEDLYRVAPQYTVESLGPLLETHARFPKRTNVEFVHVESRESIRVRVWERGAGITLACGTGACASAVAALATGQARGQVAVHLPGGILSVSWAGEGKPVLMEGPAEEVFRGEFFSDRSRKAD